jgi:hypothetical protein
VTTEWQAYFLPSASLEFKQVMFFISYEVIMISCAIFIEQNISGVPSEVLISAAQEENIRKKVDNVIKLDDFHHNPYI